MAAARVAAVYALRLLAGAPSPLSTFTTLHRIRLHPTVRPFCIHVRAIAPKDKLAEWVRVLETSFASGEAPTKDQILSLLTQLVRAAQAPAATASMPSHRRPAIPWADTPELLELCRMVRPVLRDFAAFGVELDPPMVQWLLSVHCKAGLLPSAGWIVRQLPTWMLEPDAGLIGYFFNVCKESGHDADVIATTGASCRVQ